MKKIKSPVEIKKSFANGFVLFLPANEEVVCQDDIALEMKRIYPFIEVSNVVKEEATQEIVEKTEEKKEEVREEVKEEKQEKKTKPLKRSVRPKKE